MVFRIGVVRGRPYRRRRPAPGRSERLDVECVSGRADIRQVARGPRDLPRWRGSGHGPRAECRTASAR